MAGSLYFNGQKVCPVINVAQQPVISELNVTPTTSAQTITAPSGTDGYSPVNVSAVTASIDNNIMASNIKSGVSILEVNGSVVELNGSTKTINPSTSSQTVTPTSPSNGFTSVTVPAVTSSIDANITAGNIKSGVSILGVSGTVTPLIGETRSVSITSTSGNTFTPTSGKNGITSITVTPTNQAKTITPTTSSQSITVPSGYSGFGTLTVNAVTSAIDSDIKASNIKSGVSILGVSGSVVESNNTTLSVTPSTSAQSLSPSSPYNGYSSVSVSAVTSSIDNNITAENIKKDVTILGVTGTYEGSGGTKYGASINTFLGDTDANGVLQFPSDVNINISFDGVKKIQYSQSYWYRFYYRTDLIASVSFPDLEQINGTSSCYCMFAQCSKVYSALFPKLNQITGGYCCTQMFNYCNGITTVSFPQLQSITGFAACDRMFQQCLELTSVSFSSLTTITGSSALTGCFSACSKLGSIYFDSLTTTSFGSNVNQFNSMFNSSTAQTSGSCTVHFPSNLQSTISGLTGYPTFGGNASRITLAFDLPATS